MCFSLDGCVCLVIQLCPTLCNPMGCSPPGSSVHGDSPGKNTGVGCHALLQGIFPNQGWNPGLPHCRWILYCLSHQGSPRTLEWLSYPSPGDLPDPGIEPGSPALQADSLPAELPGKPLDGRHSKLSSDALSSHTQFLLSPGDPALAIFLFTPPGSQLSALTSLRLGSLPWPTYVPSSMSYITISV